MILPVPGTATRFDAVRQSGAAVTVCVTVFNYRRHVSQALDSLLDQTLELFDLVVVEDCSTDDSLHVVLEWLSVHAGRFGRARLLQHGRNAGLSAARNTGFASSETEFVFVLDADNALYPRCLSRCAEAVGADGAFAFPIIEVFGSRAGLIGTEPWDPERLKQGNYIDAMALIRRSAWLEAGGYDPMGGLGWEDYDLWCRFAELGFRGVHVAEILARYRVHDSSMLRKVTNVDNGKRVRREIQQRHPWLEIGLDL